MPTEADWTILGSDSDLSDQSFQSCEEADAMSLLNVPAEPATLLCSKVTDWVEQQALQDAVAVNKETGHQEEGHNMTSSTRQEKCRKYDIATLLHMRYTTSMSGIELRIHPSLLRGKLILGIIS